MFQVSFIMAALLKDHMFQEYSKVLKIPPNQLVPSDPDKKQIEKAFRRCALKTHPDKASLTLCILFLSSMRQSKSWITDYKPYNFPGRRRRRVPSRERRLQPPDCARGYAGSDWVGERAERHLCHHRGLQAVGAKVEDEPHALLRRPEDDKRLKHNFWGAVKQHVYGMTAQEPLED